ncbi:DUF190 domain-containing protein [Cloacibacterium caeni]|uniref:DUF190 domain-containing protein n=1 Tax=Cloacibacterium caeni TaxID=2004710 RepID=UPI001BD1512C|nr:DUF190 domain-containing protein [Cloacibacterium caeni]
MENKSTVIVRIYFEYGASVKDQSFWKRLWNNSLGEFLLKKARESNIEQANIFIAKSGYLNYKNISYNISELPALKNPACLELIDNENKINQFLKLNKDLLKQAKIILVQPSSEILFT